MSADITIIWQRYYRRPGVWLRFDPDLLIYGDDGSGNLEKKLDIIAKWCKTNSCGRRMSYDMWQFKTEAEITMFLLAWS